MKVLVICHLEPDFQSVASTNLELLAERVAEFSEDFDHVINITSQESLSGNPPFGMLQNRFEDREWIWGFDKEYYTDPDNEDSDQWKEGVNYIATSGHEWSEIHEWMRELNKSDKYTLVGGCRSECLQDIYDIFQYLDLDVDICENLTY